MRQTWFYDIESGHNVGIDQIRREYEEAKAEVTFDEYLRNCQTIENGTLEPCRLYYYTELDNRRRHTGRIQKVYMPERMFRKTKTDWTLWNYNQYFRTYGEAVNALSAERKEDFIYD